MAEPGAADTSAQTASQLDETEKETKSEQVTIDVLGVHDHADLHHPQGADDPLQNMSRQ